MQPTYIHTEKARLEDAAHKSNRPEIPVKPGLNLTLGEDWLNPSWTTRTEIK
jgi:hypothetical protein